MSDPDPEPVWGDIKCASAGIFLLLDYSSSKYHKWQKDCVEWRQRHSEWKDIWVARRQNK